MTLEVQAALQIITESDRCNVCGGDPERWVAGRLLCDEHARSATMPAASEVVSEAAVDPQLIAGAVSSTRIVGPDGYRYTDAGNAERMLDVHGALVRYVPVWGRWLYYDGGRWRIDHGDTFVSRLAAELGPQLLSHVSAVIRDAKQLQALAQWVRRCESAMGIAATLKVAASHPDVAIDHELLDANGWLLNVRNGTLDLRSGALRGHRPRDLLTLQAAVTYDEDAGAPGWTAFLEAILPDPDVRSFVQRLAGLALVGRQIEHILPICLGGGANGKSTLTRIIATVLGDYAAVAVRDVLLAAKHDTHPTAKADLFRCRFAHSGELPAGARLDEAQVKELTGGDRVKARRMREDFWFFDPSHLLWLHANHRPLIEGTDDGIWRRVLLIPFDVQIPASQRDPYLADRILDEESAGVLNWMLAGLADYQANGLTAPATVEAATTNYRTESDSVKAFLADSALTVDPRCSLSANELLALHSEWFNATGSTEPEKGHYQRVTARLKELGAVLRRTNAKGRVWHGVGVADDAVPTLDNGHVDPW